MKGHYDDYLLFHYIYTELQEMSPQLTLEYYALRYKKIKTITKYILDLMIQFLFFPKLLLNLFYHKIIILKKFILILKFLLLMYFLL